ncbi:MAG: hypothetical protein RLY43_2461 [Bacteroidota bacterium]|jgi:uncharacterized protein YbgA (DUF1722 family)
MKISNEEQSIVDFCEFLSDSIKRIGWKKTKNAILCELTPFQKLEQVEKYYIDKVVQKYVVSIDELLSQPIRKNKTKEARMMLTGLLLNVMNGSQIGKRIFGVSKSMVSKYRTGFNKLRKTNKSFNQIYLELLK